jgi:hypothetical protein
VGKCSARKEIVYDTPVSISGRLEKGSKKGSKRWNPVKEIFEVNISDCEFDMIKTLSSESKDPCKQPLQFKIVGALKTSKEQSFLFSSAALSIRIGKKARKEASLPNSENRPSSSSAADFK